MVKRFPFPPEEKLKSSKAIEHLFREGMSFAHFPVRIVYSVSTANETGIQVAFSASKKKFKKAVDRNRIKRLMREAYRLSIPLLRSDIQKQNLRVHAVFIYTGHELPEWDKIINSFEKIIHKLQKELITIV